MKREPYVSAQLSFVGGAALAIGVLDAALIATSRLDAAGAFQYVPPRVWLAAPLSWMVFALALAVPFHAISRRHGPALTAIAAGALFGGVRLQGAPRWMIPGAVMIVAGAVVVWLAGRWWVAAPRRIAAAIVAILAAAISAMVAIRTDRPQPRAAAAAVAGPDVVVVFLDTVSYDAIVRGGVDPRYRFFTRVAARGVVFDRAYTPAPWTLPAHFAAMTGTPAHRLGIGFDHQTCERCGATLAERFHRRGYRTAAVISNTFLNRGTGFARGFDTFEHAENALDVCRTVPGMLLDRSCPWFAASVCNWPASEVTRRAIARAARDEGPLFLTLNYMDAHDPYYVERDCARPAGAPRVFRDVAPSAYRQRYYASHLAAIQCIDRRLGELAAQLDRRGRGTVFVVLGDHGEQFGEHGLVRHGNSLYTRLLHVPFMIEAPGLAPRRVAEPVSIELLPRIVFDAVDRRPIDTPAGDLIASLRPAGATAAGERWSLIRGSWHFIQSPKGALLYDLAADPAETRNLAASAAPIARELATAIDREKATRVDPRSTDFRSVGYVH